MEKIGIGGPSPISFFLLSISDWLVLIAMIDTVSFHVVGDTF